MKRWLLLPIAALAGWITWDLNTAAPSSLRDFNPHEVARLETSMWRSYYEHRSLALYGQLVQLLRQQYHLNFWTSTVAAYHAAHAALVFQRGHHRAEHTLALPDLVDYYAAIRRSSDTPFSVDKTAVLELEWWIIHRQRESHAPDDLETALAALQAEIYREPADDFSEHARTRAQAMVIRDDSAAKSGTSEADWHQIASLLDQSWTCLKQVVATSQSSRL